MCGPDGSSRKLKTGIVTWDNRLPQFGCAYISHLYCYFKDGANLTFQKLLKEVSQLTEQPCDSFLETRVETTPPFAEKRLLHGPACAARGEARLLVRVLWAPPASEFTPGQPLPACSEKVASACQEPPQRYHLVRISWLLSHAVKFKSRGPHSVFEKVHPTRK